MNRKPYLKRLAGLHAAAVELAAVIRAERLTDSSKANSRTQAAHIAVAAVHARLLALEPYFCRGIAAVDDSHGALPGAWNQPNYGDYYPPVDSLQWLREGELDKIVAAVSNLFAGSNSLHDQGFCRNLSDGGAVPARVDRDTLNQIERAAELLAMVVRVRANAGGAPQKWNKLLAMADEMPQADDKQIVSEYNRRYAGPIGKEQREKATVSALRNAQNYRAGK